MRNNTTGTSWRSRSKGRIYDRAMESAKTKSIMSVVGIIVAVLIVFIFFYIFLG